MKYGICAPIDAIQLVERLGYDYLEAPVSAIASLSEAEFQEKAEAVQKSRIRLDCLNLLFPKNLPLIGPDARWPAIEDYLHGACERVVPLGGKTLVFGSGKSRNCPAGIPFGEACRRLAEVTRKAGGIAESYGLTIAIEPLNRSESNMINSIGEGAMLVSDVGLGNVRLLADSYHMFRDGEPVADIVRVGSLSHVHVAVLENRGYPLAADERLAEFFGCLAKIHYDGTLSIEGKTDNFERDAAKGLEVIRSLTE